MPAARPAGLELHAQSKIGVGLAPRAALGGSLLSAQHRPISRVLPARRPFRAAPACTGEGGCLLDQPHTEPCTFAKACRPGKPCGRDRNGPNQASYGAKIDGESVLQQSPVTTRSTSKCSSIRLVFPYCLFLLCSRAKIKAASARRPS